MNDQSGSPPPQISSSNRMSQGQRAYEERRAGKAGISLDQWIDVKEREKRAAARAAAYVPKKPGVTKRIIGYLQRLFSRETN